MNDQKQAHTTTEAQSQVSVSAPSQRSHSMEQKSLQPSDAVGRDDDSLQVDETGTLYPPLWKTMLIISGLFMGVFLVALDQTIIGTAIPKITDEFKTIQVNSANWSSLPPPAPTLSTLLEQRLNYGPVVGCGLVWQRLFPHEHW